MKRRIVRHPGGSPILSSTGRGGPAGPGGALGPAVPVNPIGPGSPPANAAGQGVQDIGAAIGAAFQQAILGVIAPGQVLLGVILVAAGLLLATGQMGRVARGAGRAGLFAATRGAVR